MPEKFKKLVSVFSFVLAFLLPLRIYSWGNHYIITYYSLTDPDFQFLDREVPVESLEDFIKKEKEGLLRLFQEYYLQLHRKKPHRVPPQYLDKPFDVDKPTVAGFIKAARLNPGTKFLLVRRILPGAKPRFRVVPAIEVYPFYKDQTFFYQFEDVTGKTMTLREILITYSDEPDWIMDHQLWDIAEYGYGKQPYGEPEGESSKAPFHMQFLHEPWLVRNFAPFLLEGMVTDRILLFTKLAKFAKETGHEYWAYRFLAWALHYYQDLAQPYHARAVPEGNTWYYVRYIFSFDKKKFQERTTKVLKNKHFIYEDFVAVYLEKSFTDKDPVSLALVNFLKEDTDSGYYTRASTGEARYEKVLYELTKKATSNAYTLDKTIQKVFGQKYTDDPEYDIEQDPEYNIQEIISVLDDKKKQLLLEVTQHDFLNTAQITKFAVMDLYLSTAGNE